MLPDELSKYVVQKYIDWVKPNKINKLFTFAILGEKQITDNINYVIVFILKGRKTM